MAFYRRALGLTSPRVQQQCHVVLPPPDAPKKNTQVVGRVSESVRGHMSSHVDIPITKFEGDLPALKVRWKALN